MLPSDSRGSCSNKNIVRYTNERLEVVAASNPPDANDGDGDSPIRPSYIHGREQLWFRARFLYEFSYQ